MDMYMYVYMYVCMYVCMYIYIPIKPFPKTLPRCDQQVNDRPLAVGVEGCKCWLARGQGINPESYLQTFSDIILDERDIILNENDIILDEIVTSIYDEN